MSVVLDLLQRLSVRLLVVVTGGLLVVLVELFLSLTSALEPLSVPEVDYRWPEAADLVLVLAGLEIRPAGVTTVSWIQLALSGVNRGFDLLLDLKGSTARLSHVSLSNKFQE